MDLIGIGIYSIRDASRIAKVPTREIRRWLHGYSHTHRGETRFSEPLWHPQIESEDDFELGFLDLLELMFVKNFRAHGVSLHAIRLAVARGAELFGSERPFVCQRFQTDGRSIFATVLEQSGEERLLDIVKSQYAFRDVISPSLSKGIEFDGRQQIARWFPMFPRKQVVLDPSRAFGRPIAQNSGVPTEVLAAAVKAEGTAKRVAHIYDVPLQEVKVAVQYEQELDAVA
ncbi:MAG TPA: DUF433 domain-containing protein [Gammaproteobacteria bacterium]|nr:DUF433 domain-containing protein [Gammaproteobacteria bacterium]